MKQIRNEITEKSFGTFIREKREQMGLSVRALALKIDISAVYLSDIEKFVSNLVDFTSKYYSMFHSEEPKTLFTISCELSSDLSTIKLDNQMTIKKNVKALGSIQLEVENLIENPQENSKKLFHKIIESVNFSDK